VYPPSPHLLPHSSSNSSLLALRSLIFPPSHPSRPQVSRGLRDDLLGPGSDAFWRTRGICPNFTLREDAYSYADSYDKEPTEEDETAAALARARSLATWLDRYVTTTRPARVSLTHFKCIYEVPGHVVEAALAPFLYAPPADEKKTSKSKGKVAKGQQKEKRAPVPKWKRRLRNAVPPLTTCGSLHALPEPPTRIDLPEINLDDDCVRQIALRVPPRLIRSE
jgi:hypothetical protein